MSDEEQTPPTPEDEAPTPEDAQQQDGAKAEGDPAVDPQSSEQSGDGEPAEGQSEMDEDAAKALAAAQEAISAAMGGDDASPQEPSEDTDEPTAEELEMLAAMQQAVDEANGVTAPAIGGDQPAGEEPVPFSAPSFTPTAPAADDAEMAMLGDVNVDVRIELGRTRMLVEDVLRLGEGAVVELEKLAGDPVDVYVNGRHVARGEVLVLNENFCVRVNEVINPLPAGRQSD